jgi:hypothetical protein
MLKKLALITIGLFVIFYIGSYVMLIAYGGDDEVCSH